MLEEDVPKAKAALKSANLRVIGTERVNATFGVMFHDPIFGRAPDMYDLVTIQHAGEVGVALATPPAFGTTPSAGDGQAR